VRQLEQGLSSAGSGKWDPITEQYRHDSELDAVSRVQRK
jgi:hypothetical protein